jgi:hypothetical protein
LKKHLIIFFVLLTAIGKAQFLDSLHKAFAGKKSIDFGYGSRNAFIDHNRINVQSLKIGVDFGKISIGGGFSWLTTKISDTKVIHDQEMNKDTTVQRQLSFSYLCYYVEYTYYKSRRWECSIPMQIGVGKLGYAYNYKGIKTLSDQGYCFVYEPEIDVKFKVFRWIGLEGDIGYRLLIKNDPLVKKTFNSPLFSFGAFILWDELALMMFKKNKWVQRKFGPSDW